MGDCRRRGDGLRLRFQIRPTRYPDHVGTNLPARRGGRRKWPANILLPYWDHDNIHRMRVIARRTLREFVESLAGKKDQPAVKAALDAWFDEVSKAAWKST